MTFCGGINEDGERKYKKIIKYILERVLWGGAVRLSYIQDACFLKVKDTKYDNM